MIVERSGRSAGGVRMYWGRVRDGGFVGRRLVGRSVGVWCIRGGGGQEGVRRVWVKRLFSVQVRCCLEIHTSMNSKMTRLKSV